MKCIQNLEFSVGTHYIPHSSDYSLNLHFEKNFALFAAVEIVSSDVDRVKRKFFAENESSEEEQTFCVGKIKVLGLDEGMGTLGVTLNLLSINRIILNTKYK